MWCRLRTRLSITSRIQVGIRIPLRRSAGDHRSPELSRSPAKSLIHQVADFRNGSVSALVSTEGFEVSLMSKLDHPNVVRLFETFVEVQLRSAYPGGSLCAAHAYAVTGVARADTLGDGALQRPRAAAPTHP